MKKFRSVSSSDLERAELAELAIRAYRIPPHGLIARALRSGRLPAGVSGIRVEFEPVATTQQPTAAPVAPQPPKESHMDDYTAPPPPSIFEMFALAQGPTPTPTPTTPRPVSAAPIVATAYDNEAPPPPDWMELIRIRFANEKAVTR